MSNNLQTQNEIISDAQASQQISYGRSVRSNNATKKSFTEVLDTIRTGNGITDEISKIRACSDTNKRNKIYKIVILK